MRPEHERRRHVERYADMQKTKLKIMLVLLALAAFNIWAGLPA